MHSVFWLLLGVTKFLFKRQGNFSWPTFLVKTVLDNKCSGERSQILHKQTALANAGGIFQLGAECWPTSNSLMHSRNHTYSLVLRVSSFLDGPHGHLSRTEALMTQWDRKKGRGENRGRERERENEGRVRGGLTCCDSSGQRLTDAQRPVTMRPAAIKRVILSHVPLRRPPSHCCRLQSLL